MILIKNHSIYFKVFKSVNVIVKIKIFKKFVLCGIYVSKYLYCYTFSIILSLKFLIILSLLITTI